MQIRFLATVDAEAADRPFVRGQVIEVTQMTSAIRSALRDGRAEVLRDEGPDFATIAPAERAVTRGRAMRRRA